jgi:hypothetical protein
MREVGPLTWTGIYGILIGIPFFGIPFGKGLVFWSVVIMAFEFFFNRE